MLSQAEIKIIRDYFADKIAYQFKNEKLLIQALTRPSAVGVCLPQGSRDFESLEFVGDRVLNLAIAEQLYRLNPRATPNKLSHDYIALTRNSDDSKQNGGPLYRVAKELNIEPFIIKSPQENLTKYGSRGKKLDAQRKTKEGILADHMEALIGAIYLDCNQDMKVINLFVQRFWSQLGLNEDSLSESSFGRSTNAFADLPNDFHQIRQNNILLSAAKLGNWQNAELAITAGANPSAIDEEHSTALHYFAGWGNIKAITSLLEMRVDIDALDQNGWTPIMHAAASGQVHAFESLANDGASIDTDASAQDGELITTLSLAAANAHSAIVKKILFEYQHLFSSEQISSAYRQAEKNKGIQALILKANKQHKKNLQLFDAIVEWLADHNEATWAAIKNLIMQGADVRARNAEQKTIFHLIADSPLRFMVINYIFLKRPVLNRLDLSRVPATLFLHPDISLPQFEYAQPGDKWVGLSLRYANLPSISLLSIKVFERVDFSHGTLNEVEFHPEAKFINCDFTGVIRNGTKVNTYNMDANTYRTFANQDKLPIHMNADASSSSPEAYKPVQNKVAENSASFWCSKRAVILGVAGGLVASGLAVASSYMNNKTTP
jgi:dsRNA-specific ribonuclease